MERVAIRKFPDGELIALFIDLPHTPWDAFIKTYRIGKGTGGALPSLLNELEPASKEESKDLLLDLTNNNYNVKIVETW